MERTNTGGGRAGRGTNVIARKPKSITALKKTSPAKRLLNKDGVDDGPKPKKSATTKQLLGRRLAQAKRRDSAAPRPVNKKCLKPVLKVGDKVFAAWWPSPKDKLENNDPSWYAGKITSVKEGDSPCFYGPTRYYSIAYDDGDELDHVDDLYVFKKKDYVLMNNKRDRAGDTWIGVKNVTDARSMDEWARYVGWWVAYIDGRSQAFSLLSEALRAYDASVIRGKGDATEPSDLNLPNEWE